jgi:thiamine-monophosphate kinase
VGEFEAIQRIRDRFPVPPRWETWIGDDAAVVASHGGHSLLAADLVVAGVHADLGLVGLDDAGWKSVAVNVSDIAAMGGYPRQLLVSVAGPPDTDLDLLYDGIAAAAEAYGCPVVGGDLSSAPVLVIAVTVVGDGGEVLSGPPPVLRSGALVGDGVFVTGPLGRSAAGLRLLRAGERAGPLVDAHRRPNARILEGRAARFSGATAMIDVSDGFGADLVHVLEQSGVGFELGAAGLPVAPGATEAEAWGGGEDYELIFTAPSAGRVAASFADAGLVQPIRVGSIVADVLSRPDPTGWVHRWP